MKKIVFLIPAILLLNFCIAAQDKSPRANPDFTGTWIFDAKASQVANDFKRDFKDYTLVIVHAEPQIKITRSAILKNENISADLILYTDKRGEKNQPYFRVKTQEVTSKSFWKKGVLVREFTETMLPNSNWQIRTNERYILSEDKKTLIIISTSNVIGVINSDDTRNYKWVFRRKE
ncbi:MAG TPA: hypothetical protein VF721_02580 [Pyrinomonadaceae bacterium]|jgi:hypothetical protein